nr:MAG TPA: hypothetical protein [Caudoviricetes sp.]
MTVCDDVVFQSVFTVSKIPHSDAAKLPIFLTISRKKSDNETGASGFVPLDNLVLKIAVSIFFGLSRADFKVFESHLICSAHRQLQV